jgi:DNA-binding MarR family transcriptional regulator
LIETRITFTDYSSFARTLSVQNRRTETPMSVQGMSSSIGQDAAQSALLTGYLDSITLVERLHRLLLDVIKDEFERLGVLEINAVQALLLFNIAGHEVTAGELKSRGYYQGSNVSYNLKKLVELGYMHHQRSEVDRRSVRVRLTEKGRRARQMLQDLFARHAEALEKRGTMGIDTLGGFNGQLRQMERFWADQIRYIY